MSNDHEYGNISATRCRVLWVHPRGYRILWIAAHTWYSWVTRHLASTYCTCHPAQISARGTCFPVNRPSYHISIVGLWKTLHSLPYVTVFLLCFYYKPTYAFLIEQRPNSPKNRHLHYIRIFHAWHDTSGFPSHGVLQPSWLPLDFASSTDLSTVTICFSVHLDWEPFFFLPDIKIKILRGKY